MVTSSGDAILTAVSVRQFVAILEAKGYVVQLLNAPDGAPLVRYLKLDVDVIAGFRRPLGDGKFGIVVLNSYFKGGLPAAAINRLNAIGVLPKFYVDDTRTVAEMPLTVEAGWPVAAIDYALGAFEETLRAYVQKRLI